MATRIVLISDTHENNLATKWNIPTGDILIHAGDCSARGKPESIAKFSREMSALPHRFKFFVPGNHDKLFMSQRTLAVALLARGGVMTLIDEQVEVPPGLRIYGCPWQQVSLEDLQMLTYLGFDTFSDLDVGDKYKKIPGDIDVLVTHQPPAGILSLSNGGEELGSSQLANELTYRLTYGYPRLHVFGHVHEQHGWRYTQDVLFVNAALCDPVNRPLNPPVVVDIDEFGASVVT